MTVRNMVIRTTVTVTAEGLNMKPVKEVVINGDGVAGDLTVVRMTCVGDDGQAVE